MAYTQQARKRIRQNQTRSACNRARVSRIRTFLRRVEDAIGTGKYDDAQAAFAKAMPMLHASVNKGDWHRNTVARKLSRLSRRIKNMKTTAG